MCVCVVSASTRSGVGWASELTLTAPEWSCRQASSCSVSETLRRFRWSTRRESSDMTATCLDTLPDSFLNSGYSSTKRFISAVCVYRLECEVRRSYFYIYCDILKDVSTICQDYGVYAPML